MFCGDCMTVIVKADENVGREILWRDTFFVEAEADISQETRKKQAKAKAKCLMIPRDRCLRRTL